MVSLPTASTPQMKLLLLKTLFLCSNLGGIALSAVCALFTAGISSELSECADGRVIVAAVCVCGCIPLSGSSINSLWFMCTVHAPARAGLPSADTVVLPPNAYERAELMVELRRVTAAQAAATAEGAPTTTLASLQQRSDMLRLQKEVLELRQTVLNANAAPSEQTAAPPPVAPREESPSAEVEAELARMRGEAALERLREEREQSVKKMKKEYKKISAFCYGVALCCQGMFLIVALVGGIYAYKSMRKVNPSLWATVKPMLKWVAVCWPLSTVLLLAATWAIMQWVRLAEQQTMSEVAAEDVTVEVQMEILDTPKKMLSSTGSEEEK